MDLCNRNDIQALLQRHGFHFSKAMGQNFLIEGWVPRDIAAASGADENTGVLEIGPGIGPLTRELARRAGKVVSVELDRRFPGARILGLMSMDFKQIWRMSVVCMDISSKNAA